ncbi:transcriptional regulator, TetR family [Peptostreptococcaceae bacterium AS15]|nr:transcriptional regulator, TetR family [Peptostreptococcaceae bacterium AS15]
MRIVKAHDERKNEIIDTAQNLFMTKGYSACSVAEIIDAIGIAKGTFYHYFKSKEEVLDAIVNKGTDMIVNRIYKLLHDDKLDYIEKIVGSLFAMQIEDSMGGEILDELHKAENSLMHQKSIYMIVNRVSPLLEELIIQGNTDGVFKCKHPRQYLKIILSSSVTLLDDGIFPMTKEEKMEIFSSIVDLLEQILGVEEGAIMSKLKDYNL